MSRLFVESKWVYTGPGGDVKPRRSRGVKAELAAEEDDGDDILDMWEEEEPGPPGVHVKEEAMSDLDAGIQDTHSAPGRRPRGSRGQPQQRQQRQRSRGSPSRRANHARAPEARSSHSQSQRNLNEIRRQGFEGQRQRQQARANAYKDNRRENSKRPGTPQPEAGLWQKYIKDNRTSPLGNDKNEDDDDRLDFRAERAGESDPKYAHRQGPESATRNQAYYGSDDEAESPAYESRKIQRVPRGPNSTEKRHLDIDEAEDEAEPSTYQPRQRRRVDSGVPDLDDPAPRQTIERNIATFSTPPPRQPADRSTTPISTTYQDRSYVSPYSPVHTPSRSDRYISPYPQVYTPSRSDRYVSPYRPLEPNPSESHVQSTDAETFSPTDERALLDLRAKVFKSTARFITTGSPTPRSSVEQSPGPTAKTSKARRPAEVDHALTAERAGAAVDGEPGNTDSACTIKNYTFDPAPAGGHGYRVPPPLLKPSPPSKQQEELKPANIEKKKPATPKPKIKNEPRAPESLQTRTKAKPEAAFEMKVEGERDGNEDRIQRLERMLLLQQQEIEFLKKAAEYRIVKGVEGQDVVDLTG